MLGKRGVTIFKRETIYVYNAVFEEEVSVVFISEDK